MSTTLNLIAVDGAPNKSFTAASGNTYETDAYGVAKNVIAADAVDLQKGGMIILGQTQVRNKLNATILPGVNDDTSKDYGPGSFWLVPAFSKVYVCMSAGLGAASWAALN